MKCLHLPIRACGKMLLLVTWVRLVHPPEACCRWSFGARQVHGAPQKTTPHQDHALLRMVRLHKSSGLKGWMRNLYGMGAGWRTITNQLLYKPTRKPLLTANHHRFHLGLAQRWQNLTMAHWQHVIFGDEPRFQLNPIDGRLSVNCLPGECFQQRCQAYRVEAGVGSVHVWEAFHSGAKSPLVFPNRDFTDKVYMVFWETP